MISKEVLKYNLLYILNSSETKEECLSRLNTFIYKNLDSPALNDVILSSEIKDCFTCDAWSGTDCVKHPYKEGCLKDVQ